MSDADGYSTDSESYSSGEGNEQAESESDKSSASPKSSYNSKPSKSDESESTDSNSSYSSDTDTDGGVQESDSASMRDAAGNEPEQAREEAGGSDKEVEYEIEEREEAIEIEEKEEAIEASLPTETDKTSKRAAESCKSPAKRKAEKRKNLVSMNVRRPGGTPSTRLPPTTAPFKAHKEGAAAQRTTARKRNEKLQLTNPKNIQIEHTNPCCVRVKWWDPPGLSKEILASTQYKVMLSRDKGQTFPLVYETTGRVCEIDSLSPNTLYHVVVLSVFSKDLCEALEQSKKHTAMHFVTRPLPQVRNLPPTTTKTSSRPHAHLPTMKQKSPLYSRIRMPSWLGR